LSRAIRFQPDPLDHALIDYNFDAKDFNPKAVALIMNESFTGCNLIIKSFEDIKALQKIKVQVGRLGILPAKIAWVKKIEAHLYQVGVQFIED
jgi:hypothetical protein